jgi:HEAT repeat protein
MVNILNLLKMTKKLLPTVLLVLLLSNLNISAQIFTNTGVVLPENSVKNYRAGLLSNNEGIIKSCVYYAGKYQIKEFCSDLIKLVENSENIEIRKMAVWSLHHIGDPSACETLKVYLKNQSETELMNCSKFLEEILNYDKEVIETIEMAEK